MRLDEREKPSCVKEAEVSISSPFMRTGGYKVLITLARNGSLFRLASVERN